MSAITAFPRTTSSSAGSSSNGSGVIGSGTSHLRITRRGRVLLTLVVIGATVAFMFAFVLGSGSASASNSTGAVHFDHVTVAAGETLWQVAEDVAPDSDPRDVVTDIMQLNNLQGTQILPGQSLAIPTKYTR